MRTSTKQSTEPKLWAQRKRQCIQDAVIELLSREGLKAVTMERVAEKVGIAKGTVYLHYRTKQELLDATKEGALQPLIERLSELLTSDLDPIAKLEAFSARYLAYFDERRDFFRVLLYERQVTRATAGRYRTDRYRSLVGLLAEVIGQAVQRGDFRPLDEAKAAAIFLESNVAIIHQRLQTDDRAPIESDAKLICGIFIAGCARRESARRSA